MGFSNETEKFVAELCREAFLSLWSIPNPYTDEGISKNGTGKELCDLLVIFDRDVLIFSVKHRYFQCRSREQLGIAWGRWFRKVIEKSVGQIVGAENWILEYYPRVFYDKKCQRRIELLDTSPGNIRIHRIAVSLGSMQAIREYYGDPSGSLVINTDLVGRQHFDMPFNIGLVGHNQRFVHVFDEQSINLVLSENDTITDFVKYLEKRETLLGSQSPRLLCPGEEQLLGLYFQGLDKNGEHYFAIPNASEFDTVALADDFFPDLVQSDGYKRKKEADRISYVWDDLIEHFIRDREGKITDNEFEKGIRLLASESRLARRELTETLREVLLADLKPKMRLARIVMSTGVSDRAYLFVNMGPAAGMRYGDYREARQLFLSAGVIAVKDLEQFRDKRWIIGIGIEKPNKAGISEDLCVIDTEGWSEASFEQAKAVRAELNLFQEGSTIGSRTIHEYPDVPSTSAPDRKLLRDAIRRVLKS